MALSKERKYTIEDIYNLPEGSRAELIEGEMYHILLPSTMHQKILAELLVKIYSYIKLEIETFLR